MTEWILSSSILILIVIALRTVFKGKISLRLQYAIWGLVLLRLLIPVSFGSTDISVINLAESVKAQPAVQAVMDAGNINIPSQSFEEAYEQVIQKYESEGIDVDSLEGSELEALEYEAYERMEGRDVSQILLNVAVFLWVVGAFLVAGAFLFTNIRFRNRIMASRYPLEIRKGKLPVYVTGKIDTPCLFGLKHPAIYVTYEVADDATLLRHTVEHEATHYRHGDHIWSILRCVCLAIHWYNPLVWWAAFLSQRDAELACDEATIRRLGEGERAEYGRTLIGMTCQKKANVLITATTMTTGKSGIKERILLIARKPKMAVYTLAMVLLVSVIAVGCTFTGAREVENDTLETLPTVPESVETEPIPSASTETEVPDDALPLNQPEPFTKNLDDNKVCIAVLPNGISVEGGDFRYIIPEEQDVLLEYYLAANASAHTYTKWDSSNQRSGWWIVYQDQWWQVTESGAMFGTDQETWDGICIDADDARELYAFCDAEVKAAGIGEPVRPEEIGEIKSATLDWNGVHTVTDEYALNKIETWMANSRESSSVSCWFTAYLTLELKNGETKTIAMATDSCAYWMSEGVAYGYGEITEEGINGNEEFYSLFAPAVIHEKSKEGMDALVDYLYYDYLIYQNWSRYANQYGTDETLALMDMIEAWAAEEPSERRFGYVIRCTTGLDGAYADYYAEMLARLYELAPSEFAWACLGNASNENEKQTLEMLAYHWNITPQEAHTKLEADISQN